MKVLLIDDEIKALSVLQKLITIHLPNLDIVGATANLTEARALITAKKPELVFLDIEMSELSGFEFMESISDRKFSVIFTTAYDQYAIKAIKTGGIVDYLLKPIDVNELVGAVNKFQSTSFPKTQEIDSPFTENMGLLTVPVLNGFITVRIEDILYVKADGAYSDIYTKDGSRHTLSKPLNSLKEKLSSSFLRVHHSHIINLKMVIKYISGRGGYAVMADGTKLDISQRRKSEFMEVMGKGKK